MPERIPGLVGQQQGDDAGRLRRAIHADMMAYAEGQSFRPGPVRRRRPIHRIRVRIVTEYAWHSLFVHQLLIRPEPAQREGFEPEFTIIDLPGFSADPKKHGCDSWHRDRGQFHQENGPDRRHLLCGRNEEIGLHHPQLPAAAQARDADALLGQCRAGTEKRAIFFGLSGTGKTTLSRMPSRTLIGDDEHGWRENGVFNFEGGCYAKVIRLSREAEPEIYSTTERFGTVLENVVMDPRRANSISTTNDTPRIPAPPIRSISFPTPRETGPRRTSENVIMLTADAFGVLPPIAKLTPQQAMYHFLSGFTAKVAGTEKGLGKEPQPTFSTCFGAPFMPRHPSEYGNLLRDLIAQHRPIAGS